METNSILKLQQLHPKVRQSAIDAYREAVKLTPQNCHPYIDETYRSFEKQAEYYAKGRATPGEIITNSRPGSSFHQYAMAVDFHLQINGKDVWDENNPNWKLVINIFKKHGWKSGGDFKTIKDWPHLENSKGYTWQQLLKKYNNGDVFIENGIKYVNI